MGARLELEIPRIMQISKTFCTLDHWIIGSRRVNGFSIDQDPDLIRMSCGLRITIFKIRPVTSLDQEWIVE